MQQRVLPCGGHDGGNDKSTSMLIAARINCEMLSQQTNVGYRDAMRLRITSRAKTVSMVLGRSVCSWQV